MTRKLLKTLWVVPYVICISAFHLLSEPSERLVSDIFLGELMGQTQADGIMLFLLTMENLGFLLLFHMLFGTFISEKFSHAPAYVFSRITRRGSWFLGQCLRLMLIAGVYTALQLGTHIWICSRMSLLGIDERTWELAGITWIVFVCLLIMTSIPLNILAVARGTMPAFLIVYCVLVILAYLAVQTVGNPLLSMWNPLCYAQLFSEGRMQRLVQICYYLVLAAAVCAYGTVFIRGYDITLKEAD